MVDFEVNNKKLTCQTSPDLFSPKGLDRGTRLLLEQLSGIEYTNALDWGCGWGAMALWLAVNRPEATVIGLDSDIGAVRVAQKNAELNKLKNLTIVASHGFDDVDTKGVNLIVSNPPTHRGREVVEDMLSESHGCLEPGGTLMVVVEARLKPWVQRSLQSAFKNYQVVARTNKHVVLSAGKQ